MSFIKFKLKIILTFVFVTIYFSTSEAAKSVNSYDSKNISDYFSGIVSFNNNQYRDSYKFLKQLNGLEEKHPYYSQKYLYSLVNLGKFNEAFNYSIKLEKRKISSFESDLIIGIYYLKNKNFVLAQKYFSNIKTRKSKFIINSFVANSLTNWVSFEDSRLKEAQIKINLIDKKFENLKKIQNAFLHCYYESDQTEFFYNKITTNNKIDFSRYNYFYSTYLISIGKIKKAKDIVNLSLELNPRNVLLNQQKIDLINNRFKTNFSCKNLSHVAAEILYITANALASQSVYSLSNFYLNIAKYLNSDFKSFDTLLAENFYNMNQYTKAKNAYKKLSNEGSYYLWYSTKQQVKILNKEDKNDKALRLISNIYEKLSYKGIYEIFDYAEFLKNNDQFEDSIKYYSKILKLIKKDHPLYPDVTDGRGIAYDKLGEWNKAELDFLESLRVNPNQAYVINYLAYSWIEKSINIERSLKMLKKANNLKSNDPFIIDSLGWALFKLKNFKESKSYLQTAVELMPADPIVNDHYGDVLWMSGEKIQARYYWRYVLNLEDTKEDLKKIIKNKLILGL